MNILDRAIKTEVITYFRGQALVDIIENHLKKKTGMSIFVSLDFHDFYNHDNNGYYYVDISEWELEDKKIMALEAAGYTELSLPELTPQLFIEIFGDGVNSCPKLYEKPLSDDIEDVIFPVAMTLERYLELVKR